MTAALLHPCVSADFVVLAIDIMADQPTGGAAYQDIRGEMLLSKHAGEAYAGGQGVNTELAQARGVFIGQHRGRRPGEDAVRGGERRVDSGASLEELALVLVYTGPLAPEDELHALLDDEAVEDRLSAEESGLLGMRIGVRQAGSNEDNGGGDKAPGKNV